MPFVRGGGTAVSSFEQEEARIRLAYARRETSGKDALYAWHRQEVLFTQYRLRAVAAAMLADIGLTDLSNMDVLDVGSGTGGWLRTLLEWGARPERLHGIDLLEERIDRARYLSPIIDFRVGSGWRLPFADGSMDLVSAHTVFSSILDPAARQALAAEMRRVLRPGGVIFIYDFRVRDPRNPDTVGIGAREVRRLFPDMTMQTRSLTLAPPLLRRLAPVSPLLAAVLESFCPFLRTHAIHFLTCPGGPEEIRSRILLQGVEQCANCTCPSPRRT